MRPNMKIGFAIGSLKYSGAEKIARHLVYELYKRGYEIGLILLSEKEPYNEFAFAKQYPILTSGSTIKRVISRQKKIRAIVKREKYDLLISFGVKFNIDVMEALLGTNTKVILCERNDPVNDPHNKFLRLRRRFAYPFASGFVFQTEKIADFFGKRIKDKSTVIPNFIEKQMDYQYNPNAENIIMLTARLDDRQKNISMLLRAFSRFSANDQYKLVIVGDGPDRGKFEKLVNELGINNCVQFVGKQNVYDYLPKAQFFVLPSYYEGMPNSLIEAMSIGLPCIATNCSGGGAAALIKDGINGVLIDSDNEDSMVKALELMASDEKFRCKISKEAYEINYILEFSLIINKWVQYLERVAGTGK